MADFFATKERRNVFDLHNSLKASIIEKYKQIEKRNKWIRRKFFLIENISKFHFFSFFFFSFLLEFEHENLKKTFFLLPFTAPYSLSTEISK